MRPLRAFRLFCLSLGAICTVAGLIHPVGAQSESPVTATAESTSGITVFEETPLRDRPLLFVSELSADDLLNLRAEPRRGARILGQLSAGSWALPDLERVPPSAENGNIAWVKTWYCGDEAWMAARFVSPQPEDFPAIQDCPTGLVDPLEELGTTSQPVNLGEFASVPDEQSVQDERLSVDGPAATRRDLGQSVLSTSYVSCLSQAQTRTDADNASTASARRRAEEKSNAAMTTCLAAERDRWREDLEVAYTLLVGSVPVEQLRVARDEQRSWVIALQELCGDVALSKAKPFTRLHLETCELKMMIDRTIALEAQISAVRSDGSASADAGIAQDGRLEDALNSESQ